MSKVHSCIIVVLGIVDAAHHPLVIAKEEYRETSDAVDSDKKSALLQVMYDIVSGDAICAGPNAYRRALLTAFGIEMFIALLYRLGKFRLATMRIQNRL